jgi:hypothetical protein
MLKSTAVFQAQTNPPEQSEIRELEVVVLDDKKKGGRPLKLTDARFRRMLTLIREGHTNTATCKIEGIRYTTWREHIQHKPEWRTLVAEAEKVRDEVWRDYALEMIKNAMPKNWQAAMTYLERRHPGEFALKVVNRQINGQELVLDRVTPEQLVEDIRLAQQIANERVQLPSSPVSVEAGP